MLSGYQPCLMEGPDGGRGSFELFWRAVKPLGPRFVHYSVRPWMERGAFRMESREFLRRYPEIRLMTPEVKNVLKSELHREALRMSQHIVVPQAPLEIVVYSAPFAQDWPRPYKFCFQGTILNSQRAAVANVLSRRNDSLVKATCRRDRETAHQALNPEASARVYAQCEFCPLPLGDSLSDTRFFDAMRSGCLPISFEALRPLPFAHWLDYNSWALLQRQHDERSIARAFDRLAQMPKAELHHRRQAMARTIRQITFSECAGRPGLFYALAALKDLPVRYGLEDLWGFHHLDVEEP